MSFSLRCDSLQSRQGPELCHLWLLVGTSTTLKSKYSTSSTKFGVFFGSSENQDGRPCLWFAQSFLPLEYSLQPLTKIQPDRKQDPNLLYQTWECRSENRNGHPGLWLAKTFSTFYQQSLNRIHRNLAGDKISTSFTKFVFIRPIERPRCLPWPLIGWDIFDFFSANAKQNLTILAREQDPNVLCLRSLCFSGRS